MKVVAARIMAPTTAARVADPVASSDHRTLVPMKKAATSAPKNRSAR